MSPSLEDRIRALEGFRYAMLGHFNAQQTLLLSAWQTLLKHHSDDPVATAEHMRRIWLQAADVPSHSFSRVDPAHLDAVSQVRPPGSSPRLCAQEPRWLLMKF